MSDFFTDVIHAILLITLMFSVASRQERFLMSDIFTFFKNIN